MHSDEYWMKRAIRLAKKGWGTTSPNPMVGAVIVKNGRLLGEGWHQKAGEGHAEVNAFASLKNHASAKGATLYVTLEPCSSYGRTPPCCKAIIEHGIKRVVAGCVDPNPKHGGAGFRMLQEHGIETVYGVCEKECLKLNEPFFCWIRTHRPYVILKLAETLDGKIATSSGSSQWITGPEARKHVMSLRMLSDAVLTGANTFRQDHPSMTARKDDGTVMKTPRRFVAAHHPETLDLPNDWESVCLDTNAQWDEFLERLGAEQVMVLLIECGGQLAASALRAGIVNRAEFLIAPKILGGNNSRPSVGGTDVPAIDDALKLKNLQYRRMGDDLLIAGEPELRRKD